MPKIKIAPSILSADFGKLNEEIKEVEDSSDLIHIDVMDGHFVDNLTIGPCVVKGMKSKLPLDVHLMIEEPLKYAKAFAEAGANIISFHGELFDGKPEELAKAIEEVRSLGVKVGIVLNPDKAISIIEPILDKVDMVLLMTVYAGFGGQKFIEEVLPKIKELRSKFDGDIEIDGGINKETIKLAVEAGANVIVAGNSIFNTEDRKKAIEELRNAAQ
ncbi:ribulose-phosphate 3-epimerase [Nanoarchaeota archaeon]